MAIGRISGPLLNKNLLRDGVDLAFETDLLYLDVKNGRIGIKTSSPQYDLDVGGTINAKNLRVKYSTPGSGKAEIGNLVLSSGTIASSTGSITVAPVSGDIVLQGNTLVTGDLYAKGNIRTDGDIILGNNTSTDTVVFESEIKSDIIPYGNNTYSLGSSDASWLEGYINSIVTNKIGSTGNISINPGGGLLEINSEIQVKGRNPLGTAPVVTNVLYVTMDGDDTNDGRAQDPSRACRTISGAVRSPYYRPGTLIRVMSGNYLENNPILLLPNTAIVGDDLRTTSIEPINKTQDLFHVQSGCYIAQMQFSNGRSGLLPGPYAQGSNRGAYCTAFPPQVNGQKIDLYHSPYIQNCTNQSGPWLIDGTLFVPNQTVQLPTGFGTTSFNANTTTITVTLTTGTINVGDNIVSGPQTPGFFNARTLLLANKEFIKDQVVSYIDQQYPSFQYEKSKCARDVGIILENISYDATFGGNEKSIEAGLSYWNGVINLIEGQQLQTTDAINYINTLSQYIIRNDPAPIISTATTQVINTVLTGGDIASEEILNGINIITDILNNGPEVAPEKFISCGPETPSVSAEILLQANRKFLQEEVTAYVDAKYSTFEYRKDYCYRDVGLIVDAVSQDILLGGNTKSIEAGTSYFTGGKGDSGVAEQSIINNFTLLKDIILNGPSSAPEPVVGPNQGTNFSNAKDILSKNRLFLQTEVSAYVRSLFDNSFRLTQVQQNLCFRDLGLILDAIAEDTAAGGNANTIYAGLQYYNGNTLILPAGQEVKTAAALDYMLALCRNIIKNIKNTNLYQIKIEQDFSNIAATENESEILRNNINLIEKIISEGPDIVTILEPISLNLTTNTNAINAFNILNSNRNFYAEELTAYIDEVFGQGFIYDDSKCRRDTGFIVDSLAFDLLHEGNTQSIFAGLQYYNQDKSTIPNETNTTTNAINYLSSASVALVLNTYPTSTSTVTLQSLYSTITNIILNGKTGVSNKIVPNSNVTLDTDAINAYNLLQTNKQDLIDDTIDYINANNPSFTYNKEKCSRDIGLIVDAISQDLIFDGTSQINFAGLQYWAQTSSSIPNEVNTTTAAINYLKDLSIKIIFNDTTGKRYQTNVTQYIGPNIATMSQAQVVYDNFNLIKDIISLGTAGTSDAIVPNNITPLTDINFQYAYDLMQNNRNYLITETLAYVNATRNKNFVFDEVKCQRDLGYMIDSVSFDVKYGGNRQSIQSGVYYYNFSTTTSNVASEITQVVTAYEYLKTLCQYVILNKRLPTQYQYSVSQVLTANTGTLIQTTATDILITQIIDIIQNGPTVAEAPSPIGLVPVTNPNIINAATNIHLNREFIKAELIAYIDNIFPVGFKYDETKCRRDLGYIIDCVCFDLYHTGNRQSIQAGVYYYGFDKNSNVLTYEVAQATSAYNHIRDIAGKIIQGISITTSTGNTLTQVILANTATSIEADLIAEDIEIINDIINNGPSSKYNLEPISLIEGTNPNLKYAYDQLLANRSFIQEEIISFINENYSQPFIFDKIKCTRDTKLIVDSVALDLIYEGTTQSQFAGLQYWAQGTTNIPNEISTTTDAINYTRDVVLSYFNTTTVEYSSLENNFNLIVNIITTGTTGVTDIIIKNDLPSLDPDIIDAYNIILDNKSTIQDNVINYVNTNNPGFVYDQTVCRRDVGFILDCVAFDLLHGGNRQSVQAGVYYYGFNPATTNIINEIPQTIAAYDYLKYLINRSLLNRSPDKIYQKVPTQLLIPAYSNIQSLIPGEENITVDAINYLKSISLNVISNLPVPIVRGPVSQVINTFFDGGIYASDIVTRNYDIISNIIGNGPDASPVPYTGSGFFATTGVSSNDVRKSYTVISIISQVGNVYTLKISAPTLGATANGTLYFGKTLVFPLQDNEIPEEWASRRVDPTGAMGGSLVDGAVISDRSPIQSFVYDAFTQITQGGRGIRITNNGYAQLVSVFTIFCSVGVQVDNGGIASIVNSNANFGDICLLAKGYGKREFSGTVYNPPYPTYLPNGQYYPYGYYPKNGVVEIYLPDTGNRPHISLVMEVEPPPGHINEQGFPGFLTATPSMPTLTTGTTTIDDIDTTGIAIGNSLYIRDQYGNQGYVATGTIITDINYRSITINKGLINGGGEPLNPNYFTLYSCGNAYYTVLSSTINNSFGKNIGDRLIPNDQLSPEINSLNFIANELDSLFTTAGVDTAAKTFVSNSISTITNIINAANLTAAEAIVPLNQRIKKATPPEGASLAITTINENIESIVEDTIDYIDNTLGFTNYNHNKCRRDIRLILRQLNYDLEFGGNYYSVYSGLSYWVRSDTHHIVNLEEAVNNTALFPDGATVNFYQRSYMSASGYVFEYVGAGTNYGALPQRGIKDPVQGKEVVQLDTGKVFFTSTDQNGDFRIGPGLVVSQATGVLSGRTFTKSLFANLTPFILAIEGGG